MNITALETVYDLLKGGERNDPKLPECDSMSLRLEKFVRIGANTKKEEIDAVVSKVPGRMTGVFPRGAVSFVARLRSNLIVNQAGGILENAGLCIHPHFNVPYIPGRAVKGCARHAAWCKWHEESDDAKKKEIASLIADVFGYPTGDKEGLDAYLSEHGWKDRRISGSVSFLPAFPAGSATVSLVTDIVNCHHMEYYGGRSQDATDNESPNPQFFPAVKADSQFVFTIVPLRGGTNYLETARRFLEIGITENGIGAKTAAGYGWFECNEQYTRDWRALLEGEQRRKAKERLWERIQEKMDAFEKEHPGNDVIAVECVDAFKVELRKVESDLDRITDDAKRNQIRQRINIQANRLPKLSPFDRMLQEWGGKTPEACAMHRFIEEFGDDDVVPPELKKQIVDLFRASDGIGAAVWAFLRDDGRITEKIKKKHLAKVRGGRDAIRRFAKTTQEGALK